MQKGDQNALPRAADGPGTARWNPQMSGAGGYLCYNIFTYFHKQSIQDIGDVV